MKQKSDIKITITIILVTILVFTGIILLAQSNSPRPADSADQETGSLSADEPFFDFGTISMASGDASHVFKVKNSGSESATIKKIYTSCMCTTASILKEGGKKLGPFGMAGHGITPKINLVVQPDEEVEFEVVFDPSAHGPAGIGKNERAVYIESKSGSVLELGFIATVTP